MEASRAGFPWRVWGKMRLYTTIITIIFPPGRAFPGKRALRVKVCLIFFFVSRLYLKDPFCLFLTTPETPRI